MLEIRNTEVFGLERSIVASGNPMTLGDIRTTNIDQTDTMMRRGQTLGRAQAGSGHDNFLSGIIVQFDVKYPQYWSPEFQRYHFVQIVSSQSKMHRLIQAGSSPDFADMFNKYVDPRIIGIVQSYVDEYNDSEDHPGQKYELFMKILSNLPMGYEMNMTVTTNYLQLKGIVRQRVNHKLKEDWGTFCRWALGLPKFTELTGLGGLDEPKD